MLTRRHTLFTAAALPLALATRTAWAGTPPVYAEAGIAIDGSDPVAYFTEGAPVAGDPGMTYIWNGAVWQFTTAQNRDAFAANPGSFAPQFGGYCAWAVSRDYTAPTIPEAWTIYENRLYLNFSRRVQRRWERDILGNIARGEQNWPNLLT